jgi:hypothetical protein
MDLLKRAKALTERVEAEATKANVPWRFVLSTSTETWCCSTA